MWPQDEAWWAGVAHFNIEDHSVSLVSNFLLLCHYNRCHSASIPDGFYDEDPIPTVPNHVPWKPPSLGDAKGHFKLPDVRLAQRRDATEGESDLFLLTQTCSASFHRWHWAARLQWQLESERKLIQSVRMKAVIKGCLLHNAPPLKAPAKRCFHSRYFNIPITSQNYFVSRFGRQCWIMLTNINRKIRNILKRVFSDVFVIGQIRENPVHPTTLYNWFTLVLLLEFSLVRRLF